MKNKVQTENLPGKMSVCATFLPRRRVVTVALLLSGFVTAGADLTSGSLTGAGSLMAPAMAQESEAAKSRIPNAIQFPIIFKTMIDSNSAADGDRIKAVLKEDLVIDEELIATAGSLVLGHIEQLHRSRRLTESVLSSRHRFHKGSTLKIQFDELITDENEHIKIIGCLSKQSVNFFDSKQPREVEIGGDGEFKKAEAVFTTEQKVGSQIVNFVTNSGLNQLGTVASFGAAPVVMGVIGAVEPSMVMNRPLKDDEKHPRVKGFAYGVFTSIPGAPVIQAVTFKGSDLRIESGDEFLAQVHSPYEPAPVLTISSKILKKTAPATAAKTVTGSVIAPAAKHDGGAPQITAAAVGKPPSL